MSKVDLGSVTASLECPKCGSREFETANGKDTDIVRCRSCGHEGGTLREVRAQQMAAIKREAPKLAKEALRNALKGTKGFKLR